MPRRAAFGAILAAVTVVAASLASGGAAVPGPTRLDRDRVVVPAGWFEMGDPLGAPDEGPARRIWLHAFAIDRTEVTNDRYARFVAATGRTPPRSWSGGTPASGSGLLPVVGVSWTDACDYCAWAGGRLPTEAEWEKACRAPDARTYPWGEAWDRERVNAATSRFDDPEAAWALAAAVPLAAGEPGLRPVGSYPSGASANGVLDLAGNAAEWVADVYSWAGYARWPERDPVGTGPPWNHSIRGSAWLVPPGADVAVASRCAERNSSHSFDDPRVGFRCAVSIPERRPSFTGGPDVTARAARGASPGPRA